MLRLTTKLLKYSILLAIIWLVLPVFLVPILRPVYEAAQNRFSSFLIVDGHDEVLGILPGALDPHGDIDLAGYLSEDHKSVAPDQGPNLDRWWALVKAREDRYLCKSPRSVHGIDLPRVVKAAFTFGRAGGGSSLAQQDARMIWHASPGRENLQSRLARKAFELVHGPALFHILGGEEGLKRSFAMNCVLVTSNTAGPLGGDVQGVESAASTLFGKEFRNCDLTELALLAVAVWRPMTLEPLGGTSGWQVRAERFERLRPKALSAVRLGRGLFPETIPAAEAEMARHRLKTMAPPRNCLTWGNRYGTDGRTVLSNAANLNRRGMFHRSECIQALAEIRESVGENWRGNVRRIQLTIDGGTNLALKQLVESELARLQEHLNGSLLMPLLPTGGQDPHAQVVLAVADQDGRIIGYYASGYTADYSRPSGRFIGSTGKILAAIAMGQAGFSPNDNLLNKSYPGIHNPGGDTGCESAMRPGCMYPCRVVFARSLTLPLIWALTRSSVSDASLDKLILDCGFAKPTDTPAASAIPLGMLTGSPRTLHMLANDLLAALCKEPLPARGPHLVDEIEVNTGDEIQRVLPVIPADHDRINLDNFLQAAASRDFVQQVLEAPMHPGGTLSRLFRFVPQNDPRVSLAFAKTGTVVGAKRSDVTDLIAVGGLRIKSGDIQRLSWILVIRTPNPSLPLAKDIGCSHLSGLISQVIAFYLDHASGR